ncbi:MAG: polysaccharide biosynthesis protein [Firmicutes bacterium]|nr:polysaccharide biosynthesis protein [Candidatus Caballimonas caccae]
MIVDIISVFVSWVVPFFVLGEGFIEPFIETYPYFIVEIVLVLGIFWVFGIYNLVSKYTGFSEILRIIAGVLIIVVYNAVITIIPSIVFCDLAWLVLSSMFLLVITVISRFYKRFYAYFIDSSRARLNNGIRVMIVGAGDAGATLVREIKTSDKLNIIPVCFVDDDEKKQFQLINGVEVLGNTNDIERLARKLDIEEIFIAIPSINKENKKEILKHCQNTHCKSLILPGMYQFVNGQVSVSNLKQVSIQDLLGREQVNVNLDDIVGYIKHKVVMVTGGGGSIGSELCRQIAKHQPKQLIIIDIYENNAYDIQQELLRHYPKLNLLVLIASVRDSRRINSIFETYRPEIVFHAAAHKHVPLMEVSPNEAVKNNVSGTLKVARAADKYGVKRFVMISTDKAVNPTNIMGATKRICEMIIQTLNKHSKTEFVAVRFGNVLGSNGSVIPLFRKQIEEGGPVTVTDKNIVRYFMTIPEAVSLVLQAGAYAKGGEIFVLDMGEPVKIYDLAINMIKLSGLKPFEDIDIKITGLRPGEKLYEERLMAEEGLQKTDNQMISIGKPLEIDEEKLFSKLQQLYDEAYNETDEMKQMVHDLVPTYKIDEREIKNKK